MQFILLHLRIRAYVYAWSEYAHLFVWSWRVFSVFSPDLIGRRCILFSYTLSTGDVQCTWTCDDMQLYDNSGTSKVIA